MNFWKGFFAGLAVTASATILALPVSVTVTDSGIMLTARDPHDKAAFLRVDSRGRVLANCGDRP